jgi:type III restriction enzyme
LQAYSDGIHALVQRVYDNTIGIEIENANSTKIEINALNDNFYKKEFIELWNCINHKYAYTVHFDSDELIKKAVSAIDQELNVTRLIYTVGTGEQKSEMDREEIERGQSFKVARTRTDTIQSFASETIEYDLIGKIREKTQLTRKTVAEILKQIDQIKFMMFKINPEEFIKKVSNIINEQKSTMIVQHVTYNKTQEAPFDSEIFTQEKSKADFIKAFKAKKNVQDYVFEDSKGERKFAEELDNADEVVVYAKLPKGFYIPTPVGNYSPDWAISFKKEAVNHVYFIAETKGSLDNLQLRKIESAKIECAAKLFETMSDSKVKYGKVSKYEDLLSLIKG